MSSSKDIAAALEETFEIMKKQGKNDVDSLVSWMKDAKIIDAAKDADEKLRKLFQGCDQKNIQLEKFKEVVARTAEEQKKTMEDVSKALSETGLKLAEALQAGVSAFTEVLKKK